MPVTRDCRDRLCLGSGRVEGGLARGPTELQEPPICGTPVGAHAPILGWRGEEQAHRVLGKPLIQAPALLGGVGSWEARGTCFRPGLLLALARRVAGSARGLLGVCRNMVIGVAWGGLSFTQEDE